MAAQIGIVTRWDNGRSFGFVKLRSDEKRDRKDVYVSSSVLNGGSLIEGRAVEIVYKDANHTSGRLVAQSVTGEGVRTRGEVEGIVVRWNDEKGYGFVRAIAGEQLETFCHRVDVGEGSQLKLGGAVYYDEVDKGHEAGLSAVNLTGPGVIKEGSSITSHFYDLGIDIDEEFLVELSEQGVNSLSDLLHCSYYDLTALGFGEAAAHRIGESSQHLARLGYHGKTHQTSSRPLEEGQQRGRVTFFSPARKYGLVIVMPSGKKSKSAAREESKTVYVPLSAIDGGSLIKGEIVLIKSADKGHKSGREVATEVKGYGLREKGKLSGTVEMWSSEGSFGFIKSDGQTYFAKFPLEAKTAKEGESKETALHHMLALRTGETVTFDAVDRGGKKQHAVNIGGEGVTTEEDLLSRPAAYASSGADFGSYFSGHGRGAVGGYGRISARAGAAGSYPAPHSYTPPTASFGQGNIIGAKGVGKGAKGAKGVPTAVPRSRYENTAPIGRGEGLPVGRGEGLPAGRGDALLGRGAPPTTTRSLTTPAASAATFGRGAPVGKGGGKAPRGTAPLPAGRGNLPAGRGDNLPVGRGDGLPFGRGAPVGAGRGYY